MDMILDLYESAKPRMKSSAEAKAFQALASPAVSYSPCWKKSEELEQLSWEDIHSTSPKQTPKIKVTAPLRGVRL